jgi:streptomycin 3"-adenylyltransferase
MTYTILLKQIENNYKEILEDNLIGIYIHGSITFGCFHWENSDIDFIVVIRNKITSKIKLQLLKVLENLLEQVPKKGFEMSIVLQRYCQNFVYPTPYELHFSKQCLESYFENPLWLCNDKDSVDYDLAAHFMVIKHCGIVQYGEAIDVVFKEVPKANYIDSIYLDCKDAYQEVIHNPCYVILNLCRVYAYVKDGLILSKQDGGYWGLDNVPTRYRSLIIEMLHVYTNNQPITSERELDVNFCQYMITKLSSYSKN